MGLTIHYRLQGDDLSDSQANEVVELLATTAQQLGFQLTKLLTLPSPDCFFGERYLHLNGNELLPVPPRQGVFFIANPGEGCESLAIGLASYPPYIEHQGERIRTGFTGYSWQSFCKTQYASDPRYGGVDNFLRCHLGIVELLDRAGELGVLSSVTDESGYWEQRDTAELLCVVNHHNQMIAAIAGMLKDKRAGVQSPLFGFPNFESLEARGRRDFDEEEP